MFEKHCFLSAQFSDPLRAGRPLSSWTFRGAGARPALSSIHRKEDGRSHAFLTRQCAFLHRKDFFARSSSEWLHLELISKSPVYSPSSPISTSTLDLTSSWAFFDNRPWLRTVQRRRSCWGLLHHRERSTLQPLWLCHGFSLLDMCHWFSHCLQQRLLYSTSFPLLQF